MPRAYAKSNYDLKNVGLPRQLAWVKGLAAPSLFFCKINKYESLMVGVYILYKLKKKSYLYIFAILCSAFFPL
jgi:hypothetical protein